MSTGKKPNWTLCIKRRDSTDKWIAIGAGWTSDKGNISLKLNEDADRYALLDYAVMLFPYRERSSGSGEQGNYPKGHPLNIRRGESTQAYLERRRSMFRHGGESPEVEEFERKQSEHIAPSPASSTDESAGDYMERRRQERAAKAALPKPLDDKESDAPAPESADSRWD